jgi:hypothetical protein
MPGSHPKAMKAQGDTTNKAHVGTGRKSGFVKRLNRNKQKVEKVRVVEDCPIARSQGMAVADEKRGA